MGGDERLHPYLYVGVGPDRGWHELVAGSGNHPAGQPDCAGTGLAECARGDEIWHSVSGVRASFIWIARGKSSGHYARTCGLRMVRDSNLDWGTGHSFHAANSMARGGKPDHGLGLLRGILAVEYVCDLAR